MFPLLVGAIAGKFGIARSYWFCAAAAAGLLIGAVVMRVASGRAHLPGYDPRLSQPHV